MTTQTSIFDLSTDKLDYAPGDTALFTLTGVDIGGSVEFQVLHVTDPGGDGVYGTSDDTLDAGPDGASGTADDGYGTTGAGHDPFVVTDGGADDLDGVANGTIVTDWYVNPDDSLDETFLLTATDTTSGEVATTSFTDGAQDIWAWRNQPGPTLDSWDAGTTIQQANSIYAEDEVIPFRWTIKTGNPAPQLQEGVAYTIQLDWAFRGGPGSPQYFFDYLTTYNATEPATGPFSDITGFTSGNLTTVAVPNDPGAAFQTAGVFDLFNIDPTSVTFGSYTVQPVNANQEDRLLNITFTPDDGDGTPGEFLNVGVAWGAHLASQVDYGFDNGAASFPGASPQFVVDLDPSTSGDLSNLNINPNAIVAQGQITVIKDAVPDDPQDFPFTITGPDGANITPSFTLDDDGDPNNGTSNQIIFFGLAEGEYIITENVVSGWSLTAITGTETGAEDTTPDDIFDGNTGTRTATITVANGEDWTVTFENSEDQFVPNPAYTITKTVTDVDGGGPTGVVDAAGDVISYQIAVTNTGNTFLDGVVVTDQVEGGTVDTLTLVSGDTDGDGRLDADETIDGVDSDSDSQLDSAETWIYNDSYTVQQSDIDNNGGGDSDIDNTATVDSNQLDTLTDSASVPVEQNAAIAIDKSATVPGGTADVAGEVISYSIDVTNAGNVSLSGVTVDDPRISDLTFVGGDADSDSELDTTETWSYTGSYAVTQADLDAGGSIDNTATADSTESGPATDSATVPVEQNAAIAIDKSATVPGGTADVAGEVISYSIDVTNAGNVSLSGVTVDDPRISDLTFVGGDADSDSELDTTETWSYTGSYAVTQADLDAGGSIDNTATADSTESGPATDSATVPVEQNAAIAIDKSATVPGGTADVAGEVISYSIDVTNAGNVSLSGVTVDDPRISDLTFFGGDADSDSELDTTETWSYTGSYAVTQADLDAGGTIDNTATADSTESGPATDSATVPVEQNAAIAIDKSATVPGGTADVAGEVISYSIDVTNPGNVSLTGVTVSDPRISDLTFVGGDADSDSELDTTETWSYTGSYAVTQADLDAGGTIDNTATVDSNQLDTLTDSASVPVDQNPDITIDKSAAVADGGTAVDEVGDTINYTITVGNAGNVSLTGVTVSDPQISNLTFDTAGDLDSDSELDVNETWIYTGSYAVTQADLDAGGTILNTATTDSNETPTETASTEVPVDQNPDITIDKSAAVADGGTAVDEVGDTINYTIMVGNAGNISLTGVTVSDPQISNLTFDTAGDLDSDGELDVNETWIYTGSYAVTQADLDAGGTILNTATTDSNETPTETASTEVPVDQNPDITIDKSAAVADGGTAVDEVGDTINYTIMVGNAGNISLTGVTVSDPQISNLTFDTAGDLDSDGELDVNETWIYTGSYAVTQADLDAGGTILNTATTDSNETPTETASTEVPVDQNPDITIDKSAAVADGGTAVDEVGDTINYTITVGNAGNVSLTGVTVSDPQISNLTFDTAGDLDSDSELDVNETWIYTGSYAVTQADLDAGGTILNTATTDSNETPTETASTEVPVDQNPDITIDKSAAVADGGTAVDEVGDTINYTIMVGNAGNVSLTGVTVSDPQISNLTFDTAGDLDSDGELDVNETWIYTGSYAVTQADLDAGGTILNTATTDSNETPTETASTEVPVDQNPDITIDKSAAVADGGTAVDEVGDTINYTITVGNAGNISLTGVTVSDPQISNLTFDTAGDLDSDGELDVNETWIYTGSYAVTQADLDAGGTILNTATTDSNETPTETASTEVPVDQNPDITIDKSAAVADGGTAVDEVGDTINYTITVGNAGNVSLTGVTVSDPQISNLTFDTAGDLDSDGELDVNETWIYTGSYAVTQADLDAGGTILNTATTDSNETPTETASTEVPVDQNPDITIDKSAAVADGGTAVDEVGDTINYTITVGNAGNVSLTGVTVSDPQISNLTFDTAGDLDSDGELDVNETWIYTGSYAVTQADLDAGGTILNTATTDSNETPTETASTEVPVDQNPDITIDKSAAVADGGTAVDEVGDTINYTITVGNAGNISLTGVTVSDPQISNLTFDTAGDLDSDGELDVNETWTYEGSYTVTANDFLSDATAEPNDTQPGFIDNTATANSNETDPESDSESVPIRSIAPAGQITPTGTTCDDYISGMAENFEDFYDFQGGDIQYNDNNKAPGVINSVNPGVFFYYTGVSGRLKADADGDGTADPFSVTIDQSNDNPLFPLFETVKNDVKLYEIIDTNGNGVIDHDLGETCKQVRKGVDITEVDGDVTVSYTPTNPDALYVLGVKYDTDNTIKGTEFDPTDPPTVNYDYVTYFNETPVEADNPDPFGESGVDLSYKFAALNLDGTPTTGGETLTPAVLAPVIDAAIDYWADQGVDVESLEQLISAEVKIGDLGGTSLGETDGSTVTLDDDAAGYGWSDSLDAVDADEIDLFSVLTHEFGHVLGYDHDVMDETLGVGERDLPLADPVDALDDAALSQFEIEGDLLFG